MPSELDAQTRAVLKQIAEKPFLNPSMTITEMRDSFERFHRTVELPRIETVTVEDRLIAGPGGNLRLRIYKPSCDAAQLLPLMVYYHGGGMMHGSLNSHDSICRRIADQANAILVAVDYRLAPENRFPAAIEDAYAGLTWTYHYAASIGGDPARMAVGGDSAGGNLAAVAAQLARDRKGPPLKFQLLIYPAVGVSGRGESMERFAKGYFFEREALDWLYTQYLEDPCMASNPLVSPIMASDLSDLPPAFVITAEYDILRDDGEYYVERLRAAGVTVELHRYEGTIHGFVSMAGAIDAGRQAIDECARKLRDAFSIDTVAHPPFEVAFENEFVRIVRVSMNHGQAVPQYRPVGTAVVRIDTAPVSSAREVHYIKSPMPEVSNARSETDIREIRVELKDSPKSYVMPLDAVRLDPARYRVEFENDRVRVVRLRFAGGEKGLMVTHPPRVLVTLTDVRVKLLFADGRRDERGAPAGVAGWLEEETLQTENASEHPLEVILVEPKG